MAIVSRPIVLKSDLPSNEAVQVTLSHWRKNLRVVSRLIMTGMVCSWSTFADAQISYGIYEGKMTTTVRLIENSALGRPYTNTLPASVEIIPPLKSVPPTPGSLSEKNPFSLHISYKASNPSEIIPGGININTASLQPNKPPKTGFSAVQHWTCNKANNLAFSCNYTFMFYPDGNNTVNTAEYISSPSPLIPPQVLPVFAALIPGAPDNKIVGQFVGNRVSIKVTGLAGTMVPIALGVNMPFSSEIVADFQPQAAAPSQGPRASTLRDKIECLLDWMENNYLNLLSPTGETTLFKLSPPAETTLFKSLYTYRYYSQANSYVGVSDDNNHVYYVGPDGVLLDIGDLYGWLSTASCQ